MTTMNTAIEPQQDSARALITLLQLGRRARAAKTIEELGFAMVNETLQLLAYRQAGLQVSGKLTAVSGTPNPDPNAPYIQWLTQVMRSLNKADITSARPVTDGDLPEI